MQSPIVTYSIHDGGMKALISLHVRLFGDYQKTQKHLSPEWRASRNSPWTRYVEACRGIPLALHSGRTFCQSPTYREIAILQDTW